MPGDGAGGAPFDGNSFSEMSVAADDDSCDERVTHEHHVKVYAVSL